MSLIERLEEYTSHPWIAFVLGLSGALFVISAASEALLANDFIAGFFAVYGTLGVGAAVFAFLSSQAIRMVSGRQMEN